MIINRIEKFVRNFGVVQASINLELSLGGCFAKGSRIIQVKIQKIEHLLLFKVG